MTPHRRSLQKTAFWQQHVDQWRKSGLSQAAYCREHQLSEFSLSYYKRKFDEGHRDTGLQTKSNSFVSVQLADDVQPLEPLTLHFANGAHLSGITATNVAVVKQLARALA